MERGEGVWEERKESDKERNVPLRYITLLSGFDTSEEPKILISSDISWI